MDEEYQHSKLSRKSASPWFFIVATVVLVGLSLFGALAYLKHSNNKNSSRMNTAYDGSTGGTSDSSGGQYYLGNGNNAPTPSQSGSSSCGSGQPTIMMQIDGQTVQSCGAPIQGHVTSESSSSITVQPSSGSSQTLGIASSTKVIKHDHSDGAPSDIRVGDTVVVIADSSNSSQAGYILIDPNLQTQ